MSGPRGGLWQPLGAAIAEVLQREIPGTRPSVLPGAGIINIQELEAGRAEIGFGNLVSTVDALAGREPFQARARNIRQLGILSFQYFHAVALEDSGIRGLAELASTRRIRMLSVPDDKLEELQKIHAGYWRREIPKGTYPGVDDDVQVFGNYTHLMVRADLPDDLMYQLTRAVARSLATLGAIANDLEGLTVKAMAKDVGVPHHPGVVKFYREAGILP